MIYVREQPDPDFESLPHGRYDIVTKDALQKFPEDILQTVLERADFKFIEFVDGSEQFARLTVGYEWFNSSVSSN